MSRFYNVHVYLVARLPVPNVFADNPHEAVRTAVKLAHERLDSLNPVRRGGNAVDIDNAEETHDVLVDFMGNDGTVVETRTYKGKRLRTILAVKESV